MPLIKRHFFTQREVYSDKNRKTYPQTKESVANLKIVNFRKAFPNDKI